MSKFQIWVLEPDPYLLTRTVLELCKYYQGVNKRELEVDLLSGGIDLRLRENRDQVGKWFNRDGWVGVRLFLRANSLIAALNDAKREPPDIMLCADSDPDWPLGGLLAGLEAPRHCQLLVYSTGHSQELKEDAGNGVGVLGPRLERGIRELLQSRPSTSICKELQAEHPDYLMNWIKRALTDAAESIVERRVIDLRILAEIYRDLLKAVDEGGTSLRRFISNDCLCEIHVGGRSKSIGLLTLPLIAQFKPISPGRLKLEAMEPEGHGWWTFATLFPELALGLNHAVNNRAAVPEAHMAAFQRIALPAHYLVLECLDESPMVGSSVAFSQLWKQIEEAANIDGNILIIGPTGSGKEAVAEALCKLGPRSGKAFESRSMATQNDELQGSMIFGHEKGAFTGATRQRQGILKIADGGTIFLDEVNKCSVRTQNALLRFLSSRSYEALGSDTTEVADVRIITATNSNLKEEVAKGLFMDDLYSRLATTVIRVPGLNERREDIPMIAKDLLNRQLTKVKPRTPFRIESPQIAVFDRLIHVDWQWNLRELDGFLRRCVGKSMRRGYFQRDILMQALQSDPPTIRSIVPAGNIDLAIVEAWQLQASALFALLEEGKSLEIGSTQKFCGGVGVLSVAKWLAILKAKTGNQKEFEAQVELITGRKWSYICKSIGGLGMPFNKKVLPAPGIDSLLEELAADMLSKVR